MMRQPTPAAMVYAWHRAALAGQKPSIHDGHPECGWFKVRMVKNGPFVPASISLHREIDEIGQLASDETVRCEINGEIRDAEREWVWLAKNPIPRSEYLALKELQAQHPEMAATHAPLSINPADIRP